ncbi:MAG: histidine phosphatase family protein [Deferribacterales bacterium]
MQIYFFRHAEAVDRTKWEDDDLKRPLTKNGIKSFKYFLKSIYKNLKKPDIIFSSEAERAKETAEIIGKYLDSPISIDGRLNPGSDIMQYKLLIDEINEKGFKIVTIVSHEPDLSQYISFYLSDSNFSIKLKKGAFCHVKDKTLHNLIQPNILE